MLYSELGTGMIDIKIVADFLLLIALVISLGCSSWVDGYVKQKNIEAIKGAASCASILQLGLCIMMIAKIGVALLHGGAQ
jgi:hypothetical protein